jgi:ribose transport system substrate-binding protein
MLRRTLLAAAATLALVGTGAGTASAAGPKVVAGPGYEPQCFAPWEKTTEYFQWPAKKGPYRIALVNGYVGNTWRIQMIQTAKTYVEQPDVAKSLKEFKIISTGTDAAAQLGAIEDFINQGYDAIIVDAVSPEGFDRVIRLADRKGTILVPFDNILDSKKAMQVNENQYEMGVLSAKWLLKEMGKTSGQILEVRGLPGNSVDRDRHDGFQATMKASGGKWDIVEAVGNWDDGTAQKATADALAVHGHFDGIFTQGGTTGSVRALMDAKHPFIPIAGEGENGFRKLVALHAKDGLKGFSYGQSPALVAISIKAAIAALEGNKLPQMISVPIPEVNYTELKDGVNYWSDLTDNFFADNEFKPCGVDFTAPEIMAKNAENVK